MFTLTLGPFELWYRVKKGGMGEVWRGIHTPSRVPVAVKVIMPDQAREPMFLTAFRNEVQAVARLDHPGIITVLDFGEISPGLQRQSHNELVSGSPYLVMEWAGQGTLGKLPRPMAFNDLKPLLLFLLDALAHSHARGVIHRDLKPENVLFAGPNDSRPGPKLTDFGIAHALGTDTHGILARTSVGSPGYMAPEQWMNEWRDYGPWTDLYALGCMAFLLASGSLPFGGKDETNLGREHLTCAPPRFWSKEGLPDEFESWVFRLLEKSPHDRFQRAADAARSLNELGDPLPSRSPATLGKARIDSKKVELEHSPEEDDEQVTRLTNMWEEEDLEGPTLVHNQDDLTSLRVFDYRAAPKLSDRPLAPIPKLRIPTTWKKPLTTGPAMQLLGAGLGLYGLRTLPLVNRNQELDKLWSELVDVSVVGAPRMVLLYGSTGLGKSRMVEWLCERAHELGAATILMAIHTPIAATGSGLSRMVARHMRCQDQPREATLERVRRFYQEHQVRDEYEWLAMTELIAPATELDTRPGRAMVRFSHAIQRYSILYRWLLLLTRDRPVIVWLEDVQWGSDAIGFVEHVMHEKPHQAFPLLFIATVRDEALAARPLESEQLKGLMKRSRTRSMDVPALSEEHHRELVQNLLYLSGDLAEQVQQRTAGNPLFAVQLVGEWVRRGVLEVGAKGFVLSPKATLDLPDDIHVVWTSRVNQVLDEYATVSAGDETKSIDPQKRLEAQKALELASLLGRSVDIEEWKQACRSAAIPYPWNLVDYLVRNRLGIQSRNHWTFVHGMLCESLQRLARDQGRLEYHHASAANMLRVLYPDRREVYERLGTHLIQAGLLEEALEPLIEAVFLRARRKEYRQAFPLLDMREQAMKTLGRSVNDPAMAKGWLMRARLHVYQDELEAATSYTKRAADVGRVLGSMDIIAESLDLQARLLRQKGHPEEAVAVFRQAIEAYRRTGNRYLLARCLYYFGQSLSRTGRLKEAHELYTEAQALASEQNDRETWTDCLKGLSALALERGQLDTASQYAQKGLEIYEQEGNISGVAYMTNILGEIHRFKGDLDTAEQLYRKTIQMYRSLGLSVETTAPLLNLTLIMLDRKQYRDAHERINEVVEITRNQETKDYLGPTHSIGLAAAAGVADWNAWDFHFNEVKRPEVVAGMVESDNARSLQLAATLALAGGEKGRARLAFETAKRLWIALEAHERVAEIEAELTKCPL